MVRKSRVNDDLRAFILSEVGNRPRDIASVAATHFGVTRQTAGRYLRQLVAEGALTATGVTYARRYALRDYIDETITCPVTPATEEHVIWREHVAPLIRDGLPQNVLEICEHGVNEMVNNAIHHSESQIAVILVKCNAHRVLIEICDTGVGIFEKIRRECHLDDGRLALLELSKGKLTTDPKGHSGEGIFFTSRMFNSFSIYSGSLFFTREMLDDDDWLVETENRQELRNGTMITLEISKTATHTAHEIFRKYEDEDRTFARTHVPVRLARYGDEQLVSRSQARRVLARFERFSEVILDFKDVPRIGQAFADEIFRVYRRENPNVTIFPFRMAEDVQAMIDHVMKTAGNGIGRSTTNAN
ncbi:MAG: DUF4325 domain-containing protein [Alphaproteobacteria bacterium]|nr:DUF4325 domain-containing protein [Alphaproteobacteria bacterium]